MYHTSLVGKNIQLSMGINAISVLFERLEVATSRKNPHAETFPSGFLTAMMTEL